MDQEQLITRDTAIEYAQREVAEAVVQQNTLRAITRILLAHSWNVDNGCDAGCSGIGTAEAWRYHIADALLTQISPAQPTVQEVIAFLYQRFAPHGAWTCGQCGRAPEDHGIAGNPSFQCVYEPVWRPTMAETYYADIAHRYLKVAEGFPPGSLGRSLNTSEASKYFAFAAQFDGAVRHD